ncbi:ciliogenesis and planar polarity effector 2 isoform X2 [Triplophysa rosa]|uniref:ciliogenesis and planar polarity effector 2 isoform X2 n=1 Tax=Triplophysa rosa TaxID=992332 RepID=UPI002545E3AB|nr:ciliogenesis and planar polarity effector 2 isoform X2 [Triplophysa rosa]
MSVLPGSIIVSDWHRFPDSREFFSRILHKKRRRKFGLLEAPMMPPHMNVDTVRYKVFISGKTGVGKSALAARLAGLDFPKMHYETTESAMRRFDHMLPSCKEQVDAMLFLFSFTDRGSFEDLSNQISRITESSDRVVKLVVGTKFDLFMHTDVTESDVTRFKEVWGLPVFRVGGDVSAGLGEVAPLLNALAENLWYQDCIAASSVSIATAGLTQTDKEIIV